MTRIADLSVDDLARHAMQLFPLADRHATTARLVYLALSRDPFHPAALHGLADLMDFNGFEYLAALVLEYALAPDSRVGEAGRSELDDLRFVLQWSWGFSRHASGAADLAPEEFADRSQFTIEADRYRAFVERAVDKAGGAAQGFRAAHTLAGSLGHVLTHTRLGGEALLEEIFFPERFHATPDYAAWLASDAADLEPTAPPRAP